VFEFIKPYDSKNLVQHLLKEQAQKYNLQKKLQTKLVSETISDTEESTEQGEPERPRYADLLLKQ